MKHTVSRSAVKADGEELGGVIERAPAYQAEEPDGETGANRFPIRVNPEFAHIQLGSIPAPQPRQYHCWGPWYFTSTASWYL